MSDGVSTTTDGVIVVSSVRQALIVPNIVQNDLANRGESVWTGSGAKVLTVSSDRCEH